MSHWIETGAADDLADGTMKAVAAEGMELLLARVGDSFYAADAHCPHMGGFLPNGHLDGTIVTCPRHGSRFDLTSGKVIRWTNWTGVKLAVGKLLRSPRPLRTYPVRLDEGKVWIELG
ncbi:MAG: Rieske (2Fe-2S) protein [Actinobacteria bacterium]|nr:Rieske (2Fe-2S) protein [Actinomycetota bacterium]